MNEELLIKFLVKTASPDELEEIEKWISQCKDNANWLFEIERIWAIKEELKYSNEKELKNAYNELRTQLDKRKIRPASKKRSQIPTFIISALKYAAIVLIISTLSISIYQWIDEQRIAPSNQIEVPKGQRAFLTLSDGTKVWLNAQSRLTYPGEFTNQERKVQLEGEGYFEVAPDSRKPFIIDGDLLDVKVLGTKFNMRVYKGEENSITLSEGKVEVATSDGKNRLTLQPKEQAIYSTEKGMRLYKNVDTDSDRSWIKGELIFHDQSLEKICLELERRFDWNIEIQDPGLAQELFTCHFDENVRLEDIMRLLSTTRQLAYSIDKERIIIRKPK